MNKIKKITLFFFTCLLVIGGSVALACAAEQFPSETNAFVSNYYVPPIDQEKPFFDTVLPEIRKNIKENNKHSINKYYDAFPLANNPENFQGLGSTTYANINGKTVTAEGFFRLMNESLHNPNTGMGLLIYQCIQYKVAHPEEDVKITFSSYRTSVTTSVCVLPESKYYGYARSLFGINYDEHGFVRISYMLTEAARMGIEVTLVNQLPSYSTKHPYPGTGELTSRSHINFDTYYKQALKSDCYDKYAPGKKVSDFMKYTKVGWNVENKTADMQHMKSATVSHYLATDGTVHRNAIFFSSSNLDEIAGQGRNGHNGTQSGVIISDHDDLYRVTYNYTQLMYEYRGKEQLFELRKYMNEENVRQIKLLKEGKGNQIPSDKQIVYIGTKNDSVFELYFTPMGGSADTWDTEYNPMSKYVSKLLTSEDYIEFTMGMAYYSKSNFTYSLESILEEAYCKNPNINNKIAVCATGFDPHGIADLSLGRQIGFRSIRPATGSHCKDILVSYKENGVRHNVSMLTSCNYGMTAYNYRTNSFLVINETEKTGGDFYYLFGKKYSYNMLERKLSVSPANLILEVGEKFTPEVYYPGKGKLTWTSNKTDVTAVEKGVIEAVKKGSAKITVTDGKYTDTISLTVVECAKCYETDGGLTCNLDEQYVLSKKPKTIPLTFEASFTVNKEDLKSTTTLMGSDNRYDRSLVFALNKSGQPKVVFKNEASNSKQYTYTFDKVDVATGEKVHLSIVIDLSNKKMHCYVNGEIVQSLTIADIKPYAEKHNAVIGGDLRNGNTTYFTGKIHSVAIWSDVRTAAEINTDYTKGITTTDKDLFAYYDLTRCDDCMKKDLSSNKVDLKRVVLWQDKKDVEPVEDFEYSFAVIGDTQTMCENDPEAMDSLYDWILKNQKSQKIEYVIGLGDITDDSTDTEWVTANKNINKLNGKIPYALARGNHDDWDDFNRNLHNGFYEKTVDGMMNTGNINLSDPVNQPGVLKKVDANGKVTYVTREEDVPEGGIVKGDLTNSYRYLHIQNTDYLIMTVDFAPSGDTLKWIDKVVKAHPNHKVIIVTHAYMYRDGTTLDAGDCYPPSYYTGYTDPQDGNEMWEKCFSKHKNIVMVLSGHDPWQHIVYRQDEGVNGNVVTQMLIDAQYVDSGIGSTGMVAMFYFSNNGEKITVRYYSVEKDCYGSEDSQFTVYLDHIHKNFKVLKAVSPTCVKAGKTEGKQCADCGHIVVEQETIPATGKHSGGTATCKEKAKCSACGQSYGAVNAKNHKKLTVLKAVAATCQKEGKTEGKKCADCGVVTVAQKTVAKTGHKLTTLKAVAATCKNEGKTEGKKCSVCGTVTVAQKTVAKTGHKEVKTAGKAATCLKTGLTDGKKCSVCGKVTVAQKTIAKTAHTYKNTTTKATLKKNGKVENKCTICGNIKSTATVYYPKTIKLSDTSYTYNGKVKAPAVTVKDSKGNALKKDTDYTVSYENGRKTPGKYTVKITFKGKYEGTKRLYFKIAPKVTSKITASQTTTTITLKWSKVTGADGYRVYKYNSKTKKYEKLKDVTKTTLKISKLKAGTTYKYKVRAYTKDDGAIFGAYSKVFETATKCAAPKITKLTTTKGKASYTWSNVAGESGYQVYYSSKKDSGFKKVKPYKTNVVKGSKSKLKSKKTYYFKVRAYKKTASGTVYSSWSAVKSIKVK